MYKIKIINLEGCTHFLARFHKVGDVIDISNSRIKICKPYVKVLDHYRMVTVNKARCSCGRWIIKRKKVRGDLNV